MVQTSSTLFIACPEIAYGSYNTLTVNGPIRIPNQFGGEDFIHVIAFNCNDTSEFKSYFQELIKELENALQTDVEKKNKLNIQNSISFLNEQVKMINSTQYEHEVPKALEQIVRKELYKYDIKKNQMMYLSGVSAIY